MFMALGTRQNDERLDLGSSMSSCKVRNGEWALGQRLLSRELP